MSDRVSKKQVKTMKAQRLYWSNLSTKIVSCNETSYLVSEQGEVAIEFPESAHYPREHRVQILQFGKVLRDAVLLKYLQLSNEELDQMTKDIYEIVGFREPSKSSVPYWARTLDPELQKIAIAFERK